MTISDNGVLMIKQFEGFEPNAYQDIAGVWTIGYGSTMWQDGTKIKSGQTIIEPNAVKLLQWEVDNKTKTINSLLGKTVVNQNQFDSLASFTYNLGIGALTTSTLLKKVKANPSDTTIKYEFLRWNKAKVNGNLVAVKGLTLRRQKEAINYFS